MFTLCIFALSVSLSAEQSFTLTLKAGNTLTGERLTFDDGQFQLFQADKVVPVSVDFKDLQSVSVLHPPKPTQKKPFRLPPVFRPLTEDRFTELERIILSGEEIPKPFRGPKDRVSQGRFNMMRMAQIANYHIEGSQLDAAVKNYEKEIRREGKASTADERTWLLYLICLERSGEKETLRKEVDAFQKRYGERIPIGRFIEKASTGEFGGGRGGR